MIAQRTPAWFERRRGKVTASEVVNTLNPNLAGYKNYLVQLVLERITGVVQESYSNGAMQWGTDHEDLAALEYTLITGNEVEECEFVDHPTVRMSGASPDRKIINSKENGGVEIKCPNAATHLETLMTGKMPAKYKPQVQWQMACMDWNFVDFVSYDPRMPQGSQIIVIRVFRDQDYIDKTLIPRIEAFLDDVDAKEKFVRTYGSK